MKRILKRFILFNILIWTIVLNIYSEELQKYWENIPEELFERYELANSQVTEAWVNDFADTLDIKAHELKNKRLRLFASQLRSHRAFASNDSAGYMYHSQKTMELAKELDLMPYYYTEKISIVVFYLNNHHRHLAMLTVQDILKEAKKANDINGIYCGYMSMCYLYTAKNSPQQAIEYGIKAAECLDKMGSESHSSRAFIYFQLSENYFNLKDYEKCIKYAKLANDIVVQPSIYSTMARAYFEMGDYDNFRSYSKIFLKAKENDPYNYNTDSHIIHALTYIIDKDYDKAQLHIDSIDAAAKEEKIYCKLTLYKLQKDWQNAFVYQNLMSEFEDSVALATYSEDLADMTGELDALYSIKEKDEILIRQRYYMIIAAILVIAIIISSIVFISRYKAIKRKNKALAINIDKLIKYKQKVLELENEKYKNKPNPTINDEIADKKDIVAEEDNNAEEETNEEDESIKIEDESEDFKSIERFIYELSSRKLFTDINFNRDSLIDELHIQRRTFTKKFEAYTGSSFKEYITSLRLEYAAQLIKEHPEYTIEAIAMECGIASYVTFHRNFTRHFGIAPSSYRQQ